MSELLTAFALGNAAILTNVCILPLYPGLIAFLAGNAENKQNQHATKWLGIFVLAGVLSLMLAIGFILFALQRSLDALLPILLPLIYTIVILLGLLMLTGRNPFNRLTAAQAPILKNPYATAYIYGLMLGPMTLPCTGPLLVSIFLLGVGNLASLVDGLAYFLAFGLGFGWPLVVLPFAAMPLQRRFTRTLTQNYKLLTQISGVLLIAIGLLGFFVDLAPNL